jgi:hypothetical protein
MDADRFAALLRTLAPTPSRRALTRGLAGLALTGPISALGLSSADARRKKRKRKRQKPNPPPPLPPLDCPGGCGTETCCFGTCVNLASSIANCGACGHTCATNVCVNGACDCQFLTANCPATCACDARLDGGSICSGPVGDSIGCTTNADCPVGTVCLNDNFCSRPCLL